MPAQYTETCRMESQDPHVDRPAEQRLDALAHLPCSLVRKGHREDLPWRNALILDQMGDPVGHRTGLARACPGQYQKRPFRCEDGLLLFFIQMAEYAVFLFGICLVTHGVILP